MKNNLFTVIALLFITLSYSQITLEKTTSSAKLVRFFKLENGTSKYFIVTSNLKVDIYNANHSIYKSITINESDLGFPTPVNINIDNFFLGAFSEKIFDNDSEIEFLMTASDTTTPAPNRKVFIINEDGTVLFESDNKEPAFTYYSAPNNDPQNPYWITKTNDGLKMILSGTGSAIGEQYIYSLPGTGTLKTAEVNPSNMIHLEAYPNPSKDYVTLSYKLPNDTTTGNVIIYNIHGKKIKEYMVDNHVSSLTISHQDLASGTYLYVITSKNYKSKPIKLVIK